MNGKSRQVTCYLSWQQTVRNSAFHGVGSLLVDLIARVRSLEDRVDNKQRHAASSTHIAESRPGHNVQFESTYTVHCDNAWNGLPPTPPPPQRDVQAGLQGVNTAWAGGDRLS